MPQTRSGCVITRPVSCTPKSGAHHGAQAPPYARGRYNLLTYFYGNYSDAEVVSEIQRSRMIKMSKETLERFMNQVADSNTLQETIGDSINAESLIALGAECSCNFTLEDLKRSAEVSDEELDEAVGADTASAAPERLMIRVMRRVQYEIYGINTGQTRLIDKQVRSREVDFEVVGLPKKPWSILHYQALHAFGHEHHHTAKENWKWIPCDVEGCYGHECIRRDE